MTNFRREFCITGHTADLPHVIEFVENSAEQVGVDSDTRFDLQLAVEEACTNIIQHAYGGMGGEFDICFEVQGRDVLITLHDHGRPFDPSQVVRPDVTRPLEERRIGGLGLYLMEKLMDEVQFSFSQEGGNTLLMIKRDIIQEANPANDT